MSHENLNVMPQQLRNFIEAAKIKITKTCKYMEDYEMYISCMLDLNHSIRQAMQKDFERLSAENSVANRKIRKWLFETEEILKLDEQHNGWKGPDRWVDFQIKQKTGE